MGDSKYKQIIKDMKWSYSRVNSFYGCPYRWYLRYIKGLEKKEMFFANYGSFIHKLIEEYYTEGKTPAQLHRKYVQDFKKEVRGTAPNPKIFGSYYKTGADYIKNLKPFPYNTVAVEGEVNFKVGDKELVGYIDYLGEKDGDFYIVDNKSRDLKPRTTRANPTKSDLELDEYLRQLYLYSIPVIEKYGKEPKSLCFNCFKAKIFIEEPFRKETLEQAKNWFLKSVEQIENETEFNPDMDYFKCNYLCEMNKHCEYYELNFKKRKKG